MRSAMTHRARHTIVAAALAALVPFLAAPAAASTREVEIPSADGFVLAGTYAPAEGTGPAAVFLHQCNGTREAYRPLLEALAARGVHALAFDFRGHGESVGGAVRSFRDQSRELWPMYEADVDAAIAFLASQEGVDATRLGLSGASCGGTQVAYQVRKREAVRTAIFFSSSLPWMEDGERLAFAEATTIPLLCIAAEDDGATAERTQQVFARTSGRESRLVMYKGDAHGTPLFEQDPTLIVMLADWLVAHLGAMR
jgi:dienelactone hydrolase